MAASSSQLYLDIKADPSTGSLKKLQELRKALQDIEQSEEKLKSAAPLKKMLDQAILLSKTPFISKSMLNESARIIDLLGDKLKLLRQQAVEAKEVYLTAKSVRGEAILGQGASGKRVIDAEIARMRELAVSAQKTYSEAGKQFNQFVKGYETSAVRLKNIEVERQRLLTTTYTLQQKYFRDPAAQQKFLELAKAMESLKLQTVNGQKNFEKLKKSLDEATKSVVKQQAEAGILGRAWDKFRLVFGRVFDALIAFTLINWTQRLFVGFFSGLITANQLLEETMARLKALVPSTEQVVAIWNKLKQVTITTPFKIQDLAQASVQLKAFGVNINDNIAQIADWSTAIGKDIDDVATAFGKIVNFSPRSSLLLSTRGFSTAALDAYVDRFKDRTVALNMLIRDTFGGTAEAISKTFTGILANVLDVWTFISQTVGQPLFNALKQDLNFVFSTLKKLNVEGQTTLKVFGDIVKVVVYGAVFTALGFSIAIVITYFNKLRLAIVATNGALTQFGKSSIIGLLLTLAGSLIFKFFELRGLIEDIKLIEVALSTTTQRNHRLRISLLKEENDLLQQQIGFLANLWSRITGTNIGSQGAIKGRIVLNQKLIDQEESMERQQQRELLMLNTKGDEIRDFQLREIVRAQGLKKVFEDLALRLEGPKTISAHETEDTKDIKARSEALAQWIRAQVKDTDVTKVRVQYIKNLAQLVDDFNKKPAEGKGFAETMQLIRTITEASVEFDEFWKTYDKGAMAVGKYAEEMRKLTDDIKGQQDRYRELNDVSVTGRTQEIERLKGILKQNDLNDEAQFASYFKEKSLNEGIITQELAQLNSKQALTSADTARRDQLELILKIMTTINSYLNLSRLEQEEINKLNDTHLDNLRNIENAEGDLNRSRIDWYKQVGIITSTQAAKDLKELETKKQSERLANLELIRKKQGDSFGLTGVKQKEKLIEIDKIQKDIVDTEKDLLAITKEYFALPSPTWGDALYKQFLKLRIETEKWRDELTDVISGSMQQGLSNIFNDVTRGLFGEKNRDINVQIADLQRQQYEEQLKSQVLLGQASEEQVQITIQQNHQIELQQKINELERERVSILQDELLKVLDSVMKKLEDMAATQIMKALFGVISPAGLGQSGGREYLGTPVLNDTNGGTANVPTGNIDFAGLQRPTYNNSNSEVWAPVIHINGDIYAENFEQKVDKALRNIKRNLN